MIINTNMNALNAHRNMGINNVQAGKSMEKLSSGLRINRAGDDAAGLAISEKMRGQIRGLDQASRNAQDGISMIQTAEGALNETQNILQRMRELSVQASNDTNTEGDRTEIQKEIDQLTEEIDRIGNNTEFNTQKLLNGNKAGETATDAVIAGPADVVVGSDEVQAVKGEYTVTFTAAKKADFAVDTNVVDLSGATTVDDAVGLLNGDATLSAKYTFEVDGANIKITQKVGNDTAPVLAGTGVGTATEVTAGVTYKAAVEAVNEGDVLVAGTDGKITLQVGANANQIIELEMADMRAEALGVDAIDVKSKAEASKAITTIDDAVKSVSSERAKLGAVQNRLEYTTSNLNNTSENLTAAESRIRDVDMAKEMLNFSKNNILNQAAQSMLAQAKSQPEGVLQLLR